MPPVLWTGNLSLLTALLVNASNALAFVTGGARDTAAMKRRIRAGYETEFTDDIANYDEVGREHYRYIAELLLSPLSLREATVAEIGCGTGILSEMLLERGVARVACSDIAGYMLNKCRERLTASAASEQRVDFAIADAEALPYRDAEFDAALSSMVFAFLPHQDRALREMGRIVRRGGQVAVAAHGRSFYHEAIEAAFRAVPKRYVIGYRVEFWPRGERAIKRALQRAGLTQVETKRVTWVETHPSPIDAYRFFSGTGGTWWLSKFPDPATREALSQSVRDYFERKGITGITQDVVLAYGVRR